ncbi:Uu.00g036080.m01.CDS01 [Anthostomella pinea]|uniref:Uu.00g036080.m01.CDS01 n=1 Tax=Anthostomella pinea TaxID=933095 RepID=A0AAI8VAC3_9PEZI|nr:Uu.00g036080.m01.CDS01 [Anthostomella pinea]
MMLAKPSLSILGTDPAHRRCVLNGNAFQQDAIQSFNGWQYACFYSSLPGAAATEPLFVHLSRRKLPIGDWETLVFDDYPQTTDDGHNTVQLGICPGDGTVHLSYDHHCDIIRYRHSTARVAEAPEKFKWKAKLFTSTLDHLPGLPSQDELFGYITYPRFVRLESDLLFSFRTGKAGLGDDHLCVYKPSTGNYTLLGTNLKGVENNPYIHGLDFRDSRLYVTWVYRAFVWYEGWDDPLDTKHKQQAGPNSGENNHNICFAYSDDGGKTWCNGSGVQIADLSKKESVLPNSPGIVAFDIPKGSSLANQEAQAVDHEGGVHVLNRDNLDGEQRWKHYYKPPKGSWIQHPIPRVQGAYGGKRGQLALSKDDDLYFILPDHKSSVLSILKASKSQFSEYELVWQQDGFPPTEPLVDKARLDYDNVLSVFTRADAGSEGQINIVALDFQL